MADEILASVGVLIPGLPNDVAAGILVSLPFSHHARLRATCRAWRALLSTPPSVLVASGLRRPRHLLCLFPQDPSLMPPYLFDPSTLAWLALPTIPCGSQMFGHFNVVPVTAGARLYALGCFHSNAHAYPIDRPVPSAAAHCLDFSGSPLAWARLPDMLCPRGNFACAAVCGVTGDQILVAGGGSWRSTLHSDGSQVSSVERYDAGSGEWKEETAMPRDRAACTGWVCRGREGEEDEFWVMCGYGEYSTLGGAFRADVYYRDAVVMGLRSSTWREIGEMWQEGERRKLGPIAVVDGENGDTPAVFMLDQNDIFRYNMQSNCWVKEVILRRKILAGEPCGFVAMDGELHVLTSKPLFIHPDFRRFPKKKATIQIQAYDPRKRTWRVLTVTAPFCAADFNVEDLCTIRL